MGKVYVLNQRIPLLSVPYVGELPLTEVTPLGGGRRVNLSNLRQASGHLRIEDCPVGAADTLQTNTGKLILTPVIKVGLEGER